MFDRLIVSEPKGAHIYSRRNYFMASTLAVGTMLLTAVVFSIFAGEIGLGTDSFELTALVMPVGLATYGLKFFLLFLVIGVVAKIGWIGLVPLAIGIIVAVIAWTGAQLWWTWHAKLLYVDDPVGGPVLPPRLDD